MWLLIVYVVLATVGEFIAVLIGLELDKVFPQMSLPIALTLFFSVLVLAWPPSVWITERWMSREKMADPRTPAGPWRG
jgi:hypothetical protein